MTSQPALDWNEKTAENIQRVRATHPLVHNITNFVVMNFTANILLAAGAAPVMAHAENEVEDMVALAQALVLNIGTLDDAWVNAMLRAGKKATALGRPIILDPVGAGATALRTRAALRILAETRVTLVRGNASEILALGGVAAATRGVDAGDPVDAAAEPARRLAREWGVTLAITGAVDCVTDGRRTVRVANGHPRMGGVTGTGCGISAIAGAFVAVDADPVSAAATALAYYGLAGERAAAHSAGPGTFVPAFLDALHGLCPEDAARGARIREG